MYILYGGGFTRAHMTEMVFAEVGVPYEVVEVDTAKEKHRSSEFLKINPAGWVPALRMPDGTVLHETPAINLYLAESHGLGVLVPAMDDPDRGPFLSAMFYISDELEPALKRYFFPHRYGVRESDTEQIRNMAFDTVRTTLEVIDKRLSDSGPYHLGERFSLADLMLSYWVTSLLNRDGVLHLNGVNRCVEHVRKRPALRQLFADLDERSRIYAALDARGRGIP